MAKRKPIEKPALSDSQVEAKELLTRIRKRVAAMTEHDKTNRQKAIDDLKFCNVPGAQWEESQRLERGLRPCYEFNKIRPTVKRVVNEMRKNRPSGKVRAVEDGDKDTADVLEGLLRNIWNTSDADTVIDYACEYQVGGGMGAWRVVTKYSDDDAFEQDICVEAIKNPFCLYADNACADPIKRDARDWALIDRITKEVYQSRYKGKEVVSFDADTDFDDEDDWHDEETVRICEYWYKEPVEKTIYLLQGGQVVEDVEGVPKELILKERKVSGHKILMCIVSGDKILEGPKEWAGKLFPFVIIYGDWLVIDGKIHWSGLTRHAKDAQRSYNMGRTSIDETIALAPQDKWWATSKQALGHTDKWALSHKENMPFNLYEPDPSAPGPPARMGGPQVPVALIQQVQLSSEEIKAVTGIYDASLGNQSNETSGIAIRSRQAQGDVATFNFADNQAKGIRLTYEILIDLAPRIIDTERAMRILGVDGSEKYIKVNQQVVDPATGEMTVINDLSTGKYDVVVTIGPSYATQRQESADFFADLAGKDPAFMGVAGDLLFKSMDVHLADQMAERYRFALVPQVQQMLSQDKPMPPEVQAAMMQVQQAQQMVDQKGLLVQAAEQELKELEAKAKGDTANAKLAAANLQSQQAAIEYAQKELATAQQQLEESRDAALKEIAHAQEVLKLNEQLAALRIQSAHQTAEQGLKDKAGEVDKAAQQVAHESETHKVRQEGNDAVAQVKQQADEFIRKVYEAVSPKPSPAG